MYNLLSASSQQIALTTAVPTRLFVSCVVEHIVHPYGMPACIHAYVRECAAVVAFPTEDCLSWLILLLSHVQLIHMDLKSKNVLLNARKDLAKIADVGLSRIIQSTLGGAGSTPFGVGTFEYTAPEILLGRQCNEKV